MAASRDFVYFYTFARAPNKSHKSNVLECRVCEDVFGFQGDKVPRLLYCGHTLCHSCLLRLPLRDNVIKCPFDRQPTPVANSGVWGLKKNFALLELLEKLHYSNEKPALFCCEALAKERELGIPCDENEDHLAVLYCTVCATHLCEECSESTHSMRTLSKHRRVPLSEKPREKPRCSNHPEQLVEFTCLEADCEQNPLMCFICKDYGRHRNHKHSLLESEAQALRTNVLHAVQHLKKFVEEVGETGGRVEQALSHIQGDSSVLGTAEVARTRVRAYFQELREHLHLQEVAALTVVDAHVRERVASLRQQQEDLVALLTQVANVCVQCERLAQQDDARLLLAARELKTLLASVEQQQQQVASLGPDQLCPDPAIPITFTKDNRVHIGPKIEMRVVMLGLDGAGKTSILFKLKQNEFMPTIPTIGFNVEMVEYKNLKFTFWDVGGQPKLRLLWKHYYLNTQAVIYVLDSSDQDRLVEAHSELAKLMAEKELRDASLLIFANKQDLAGCATIEELTQRFSLYKLCCGRSWHIQACDAQSGTGLGDGLDWLSRQLVAAGVHDIS